MEKKDYKKSKEELQDYLQFLRRGFKIAPKKGNKSFNRSKQKEDTRKHINDM